MKQEALDNYECDGQLSMFDHIPGVHKPGDWIGEEYVGRELSFEEITKMVGTMVINDMSTESHKWYKVEQVERIAIGANGNRILILYDGKKQRGMIDEMYFNPDLRFPSRVYELKDVT